MRGVISAMMLGVASAGLATPPALPAGMAVGKLQELNLQQVRAASPTVSTGSWLRMPVCARR